MFNLFQRLLLFITKNAYAILYIVLGFTLLIGTFYALSKGSTLTDNDSRYYVAYAKSLASDGSPPGYPLFLAAISSLGGGVVAMRLLNVAALCGSILLIWGILKRHSLTAAAFGILLVPLYPVLYTTAGALYPQTIATT